MQCADGQEIYSVLFHIVYIGVVELSAVRVPEIGKDVRYAAVFSGFIAGYRRRRVSIGHETRRDIKNMISNRRKRIEV